MIRKNFFNGEGCVPLFANEIYKFVKARVWFSNADVMAAYMGVDSAASLDCPISKCENVKELTKALMDIREAIGKEYFEEEGNNRHKKFRYIGEVDDPLADMLVANGKRNLQKYWRFCKDSEGFIPVSWLEHFFKGSKDFLDTSSVKKGRQVLSSGVDAILTNIDMLPFLYEAIINKVVLELEYKPYEEDVQKLVFHPQYLKEYNGRWHLFGHAEGRVPHWTYDIALDRIVKQPSKLKNVKYEPAPDNYYRQYFSNIVGVSHKPDEKPQTIRVRARSLYMYMLTMTKPIHRSQSVVVPFGKHDGELYGEFELRVEINNELIGVILQKGAGLEVVAPEDVRKVFAERIKDLANLYI